MLRAGRRVFLNFGEGTVVDPASERRAPSGMRGGLERPGRGGGRGVVNGEAGGGGWEGAGAIGHAGVAGESRARGGAGVRQREGGGRGVEGAVRMRDHHLAEAGREYHSGGGGESRAQRAGQGTAAGLQGIDGQIRRKIHGSGYAERAVAAGGHVGAGETGGEVAGR